LPAENRIPYTAIISHGGYVSSSYGDVVLPGPDHAVVHGNYDERDPRSVELVECFSYGYVGPGPGDIQEVVCVDDDLGFFAG